MNPLLEKRLSLKLTRKQAAEIIGIHDTRLLAWECGDCPEPKWIEKAIARLEKQQDKEGVK